MTNLSRIISVKPIIKYPREVQIGKTYLMTIDLQPEEDFEWQYEEEEYPIYCRVRSNLFSSSPAGEPVVVLHRFGGSYGEAKFLITANKQIKKNGEIKISLINRWGADFKHFYLSNIQLKNGASTPAIKLEEVSSPERIDYPHLASFLENKNWIEADKETSKIILTATDREHQGWLDEESIKKMSCKLLQEIDNLWKYYSQGNFGFSIQRKIFEASSSYWNFRRHVRWQFIQQFEGNEFFMESRLDLSNSLPRGHMPSNRFLVSFFEGSSEHSLAPSVQIIENYLRSRYKNEIENIYKQWAFHSVYRWPGEPTLGEVLISFYKSHVNEKVNYCDGIYMTQFPYFISKLQECNV